MFVKKYILLVDSPIIHKIDYNNNFSYFPNSILVFIKESV